MKTKNTTRPIERKSVSSISEALQIQPLQITVHHIHTFQQERTEPETTEKLLETIRRRKTRLALDNAKTYEERLEILLGKK